MKRIAINGFGRIGRQFLHIAYKNPDFMRQCEVVAINDLTDSATLAYLFKHDSVHGQYPGSVTASETTLNVDGNTIQIFAQKDPLNLPWKSLNVDYVVESTGLFTTIPEAKKHVVAGAKRVLVTAPCKGGADITVVPGVNLDAYDPSKHVVVSMASCTSNSLIPMVKVLDDAFKIKRGYMTTVHSYTNDQRLLDLPHRDLRRARAAALNIIPTTTGAASAVGEVLPHLKGRLDGLSLRVPTPTGSLTDLTVEVEKETTKEEVNAAFKAAANGAMKGVLLYSQDALVSADIVNSPYTSIIDSELTMVLGNKNNLIKAFSWYDNEWGYSTKLVDTINHMAGKE